MHGWADYTRVRCADVWGLAKAEAPDSLRSLPGARQDPSLEGREASVRALGNFQRF